MAARFDNRVLAALCFEMIFRLVKRYPRTLLYVVNRFLETIDMPIQTRADRSPTESNLAQSFDRFLRARFRIRDLLRIAREFLPESHRRRVHQMRAADFHDMPEFFGLRFEGAMQFLQSRNQMVLQFLGGTDVNRRWNHVIARLTQVDVIIGMNRVVRSD